MSRLKELYFSKIQLDLKTQFSLKNKSSPAIHIHLILSLKKQSSPAIRIHLEEKKKKENDLSHCDKSTNRGLISEDRSTGATLLFTIPRSCLSRLHRIYL